MALNSTSHEYHASSVPQTQASGRSIFWALATIAMSNMLQPSLFGYLLSGAVFEGALWPHRSSPVFCAVDAVGDVWLILTRRSRYMQDRQISLATPTTVAMRLAIVLLAVLPQAVKLFSMRGVLAAQGVAALLLVSLFAGIVRSLHLESAHKDTAWLAQHINTALSRSVDAKVRLLLLMAWGFHAGLVFYVWRNIADKAILAVSKDVYNAFEWLLIGGPFVCGVYVLQHVVAVIFRGRKGWILPRWPVLVLIVFAQVPDLMQIFEDVETRKSKQRSIWKLTAALIIQVAMYCWVVSYAMNLCARKLLASSSKRASLASNSAHVGVQLRDMGLTDPEESGSLPASSSLSDTTGIGVDEVQRSQINGTASIPPARPAAYLDTTEANASMAERADQSTQPTTARSGSHSGFSTTQDDFGIGAKIVAYPLALIIGPIFMLATYSGALDLSREEDLGESAVERGESRPLTNSSNQQQTNDQHERISTSLERRNETQTTKYIAKIVSLANQVCKLFVRGVLLCLWRVMVGFEELIGNALFWLNDKIIDPEGSTVWVALGIFNFVSAMLYYLVVFDGYGTYCPAWTSVLG